MLQSMQKKITEEGVKEKELYEKFMCYCKTSGGDLTASIAAAEKKAPEVSSDIDTAENQKISMQEALKTAQTDRSAAKTAQEEATAIREKEAAAFAVEKADFDANIGAMTKAITALSKGMAGSFVQTGEAQVLRRLALGKTDMLDADRQELLAFLSASQGSEYVPASGEITGILKEMNDKMKKSLADSTASEQAASASYEELMSAKSKEIAALTASIESKTKRLGELSVEIIQMKEDLSDTEEALRADKKFLAELETGCATKKSEWEEIVKTRADELAAIAETIKILNDDDALELFKKTLPSAGASLMQVGLNTQRTRDRAMAVLKAAKKVGRVDTVHFDLVELALHGKKVGFEKVIKMVDEMKEVLKKEQDDDDHKKEYCNVQLDKADDKKKGVSRTLSDEEAAMERAEDGIATLKSEIASLEDGIAALDKSVAEAMEQRKEDNKAFTELVASNSAATEILGLAKNRLNKFCNPKLYKAPKAKELTAEQRIAVNFGTETTPAPSVFAEVSAHLHRKDAPPPPPATFDAYAKKGQEATGVIAMIDLLLKDLAKETTEAETAEQDAQKDYEAAMLDASKKRTADSKLLAEKGSAKADLEGDLQAHKEGRAAATKELAATLSYINSLHIECDWLPRFRTSTP